MPRVKRGVASHKRQKKMLKATKGFRGLRSRTFKQAKTAWMKAGENEYRDRKVKKRAMRALWITRLNGACRAAGITYSRFIEGLTKKVVLLDRKVMSEIARTNPEVFEKIVEVAKSGATAMGTKKVTTKSGTTKTAAKKVAAKA